VPRCFDSSAPALWDHTSCWAAPEEPPARFGVRLDLVDNVAVIQVQGEVDTCTAPALASISAALCEQHTRVVFDFAGLRFIDAAGLRVINDAAVRVASRGGRLSVRWATPFVRRLMELTGLSDLLDRNDPPTLPGDDNTEWSTGRSAPQERRLGPVGE
jgi:anti-sigma B factor antagonist